MKDAINFGAIVSNNKILKTGTSRYFEGLEAYRAKCLPILKKFFGEEVDIFCNVATYKQFKDHSFSIEKNGKNLHTVVLDENLKIRIINN